MLKQSSFLILIVFSALFNWSGVEAAKPAQVVSVFPEHNFKAKFPAYPEIHRQEIYFLPDVPVPHTQYYLLAGHYKEFAVGVHEFPIEHYDFTKASKADVRTALQVGFDSTVASFNGKVTSRKFTKFGKHEALDGVCTIDLPGQTVTYRLRMIFVGHTLYTICTGGTTQTEYLAFRDSFKFL